MPWADLVDAVSSAQSEPGPTLLVVESADGMADPVVDLIPDRMGPVRRAAGTVASRSKIGCVHDLLGLDERSGEPVVIENAQWVDPTSMGRVQRLLEGGEAGLLVVVAHTAQASEDDWWLGQLVTAARSHGRSIRTRIESQAENRVEVPADDRERDLALAATMVSDPIPVDVAARYLEVSESEVLELAESLSRQGLLIEARSGFQASESSRRLEVGEARLGRLAGRLASAFEESHADPGVVGSLYMAAGDPGSAYPRLLEAARAAGRVAAAEAFHLAESALEAARASSSGANDDLGELHLICGRHLRAAGRSEAAARHISDAVGLLEGVTRIDALGFAAAVADDLQHPQEAERTLAIAEWEAATQQEPAKLGSLGTFRARALNRLGFADEADAALEKAEALLELHATATQRFFALQNRAWISFDRGQAAQAEVHFTHLRDETDANDLAGLADKEAWRARALFASGQPAEAIAAVDVARELASEAEVEAPLFLADLALAEGGLLFGRAEEALAAADRVLDLVARQLPSWENVGRANRALALLRLGRFAEASAEIEAALAVTPSGADGWRWRSRCRAIQIEISAAAGEPFPGAEAEDLADMFLQSEFYGWAAELLCVIAEREKDPARAEESHALAVQIGNPMLAARAASAGSLWNEPAAAPTIRAMRALQTQLPPEWSDDWMAMPFVADALAAPEPAEDETGAENAQVLEEALERAGLSSPEAILSPAQRRSRGLVTHRARRRRTSPLTLVAAALGVVVLAVGTSLAVARFISPDTPADDNVATESSAPTTTTSIPPPPSLEETEIEVPVELLFGTAAARGDAGRSGYFDVAGPRTVDGRYWVFEAADAITATPLAYGNNLLVGGADGTFQAIDLTEGVSVWSMLTEDQIDASAGLSSGGAGASTEGAAPVGEGGGSDPGTVVVVGDDGVVRARDALVVTETQIWATPLGATIKSSPIVEDGVAYVATTEGIVYALDLANGDVLWQYPKEEDAEPLGRVTADLARADGILYVGTETGGLHLLDGDGNLVCESILDAPIVVNPVVVDGLAYVSYGQVIRIIPAGLCVDQVPITDTIQFLSETVVDVAPAVVGDLMYVPNAQFLNAIDRVAVEEGVASPEEVHHWSEGKVHADGKIVSPPVVTNDAVYFGTDSGRVFAVDSDSGDVLWEWQTGNYVRASPVVIAGAVYIASGDGNVYAVGPGG